MLLFSEYGIISPHANRFPSSQSLRCTVSNSSYSFNLNVARHLSVSQVAFYFRTRNIEKEKENILNEVKLFVARKDKKHCAFHEQAMIKLARWKDLQLSLADYEGKHHFHSSTSLPSDRCCN